MKHPSMAEHRDTGVRTDLRGIPMICFYREHNGDFLAIDTSTNAYYLRNFGIVFNRCRYFCYYFFNLLIEYADACR